MITNKDQLQVGLYIQNTYSSGIEYKKIVKVTDTYVRTERGIMPVEFYLNKFNFKVVEAI